MILAGVHPEAPASWRREVAVRDARAYAATLIDAALNRTELPHF